MKITKQQLKQIILEELQLLSEEEYDHRTAAQRAHDRRMSPMTGAEMRRRERIAAAPGYAERRARAERRNALYNKTTKLVAQEYPLKVKYDAETDPAKKQEILKQRQELRQQIEDLLAKDKAGDY